MNDLPANLPGYRAGLHFHWTGTEQVGGAKNQTQN